MTTDTTTTTATTARLCRSGSPLPPQHGGRPRVWCSNACQLRHHNRDTADERKNTYAAKQRKLGRIGTAQDDGLCVIEHKAPPTRTRYQLRRHGEWRILTPIDPDPLERFGRLADCCR